MKIIIKNYEIIMKIIIKNYEMIDKLAIKPNNNSM